MPCFKGLAVSIHTPEGPISEFSIQKQSRAGRITSYIPVPKPKISVEGNAEQSTFAISITLLTPGTSVPYSTPKATPDNPYPKPQIVGALPRQGDRGSYTVSVAPYQALTTSENETIAAYIYFDGRAKEEVATLLRRGEETWVNSRWVGVEGGGLAEREFLFKEVGLERWLNGLDLAGDKDAAVVVQKRKDRLERKRRKREKVKNEEDDEDVDAANPGKWNRRIRREHVLRYGDTDKPLQRLSDEEDQSSSDESSDDDDDPLPESTGQIKVALFRVLASGEIKKGEYSPQFDAHDDDEEHTKDEANGAGEEIDHATSFAKPKSLDPKSISTQTVTGIDPPDRPYAVFTFLYRGEKQLQKMGIIQSKKPIITDKDAKRKSVQDTVKTLGSLKAGAAERFTNIRDGATVSNGREHGSDDDMSDEDEDEAPQTVKKDEEDKEVDNSSATHLNPDDVKRQGELLSGVQKMRLKRQHSFEPSTLRNDDNYDSGSVSPTKEGQSTTPTLDSATTPLLPSTTYNPISDLKVPPNIDQSVIGSPLKKARASLTAEEDSVHKARAEALAKGLGFGFGIEVNSSSTNDANAKAGTFMFGGKLDDNPIETQKRISTGDNSETSKAQHMDEEL